MIEIVDRGERERKIKIKSSAKDANRGWYDIEKET